MDWDRRAQIAERIAGAVCLFAVAWSAIYFARDAHQTQLLARAALKDAPTVTKNIGATAGALPATIQQLGGAAQQIGDAAPALAGAASSLGDSAAELNAVMINLQRPCEVRNLRGSPFYTPFFTEGSTMPCGALADLTRTLATTRGAVGQFETIGRHVNAQMPVYDAQEAQLYADAHGVVSDFQTYMKSQAMVTFREDLARGVHSSANIAANLDATTGSVAKMTDHLEKTVDAPKPLWEKAIPGAELGAKLYLCLMQHVCLN